VRPYVAGAAPGKVDTEVAFDVAIKADRHGTGRIARHGVKAVAHLAVTVTAHDTAGRALPDRIRDLTMRGAQVILWNLCGQIAVAKQAIFRMGLAQVQNQVLVSGLLVSRVAGTPVAGHAAQTAMGRVQRGGVDVIFCDVLARTRAGGQGSLMGMAGRVGSGVMVGANARPIGSSANASAIEPATRPNATTMSDHFGQRSGSIEVSSLPSYRNAGMPAVIIK
jgi:hypothetical protein